MFEKQREFLSNNNSLYILVKCLKNLDNRDFNVLVRSYFQPTYEGTVYLLEHPGTLFPEKTIYDISVGIDSMSKVGFCAQMHHLLYKLIFADEYHLLPRVVWGEGSPYYDTERNMNNAFEYYFEPISEASNYPFSSFANIMKSGTKHILKYHDMISKSYSENEKNIHLLAEFYKKYIRLNETTQNFISESINNLFKSKKILGVHARGGDFKLALKNHPHRVSAEEYLDAAQKEFASGNYKKIFIATDDENILQMFVKCFGDNLIFYDDVPRVSGNKGIHLIESKRPMHHYKLGLELLRDVYTLVSCESFICGLSHVSFMVRYVKESLGERFNKVTILDEGINK